LLRFASHHLIYADMENVVDFIYNYLPQFELPIGFLDEHSDNAGGMYFATCSEKEFMFVDTSFSKLTGYDPKFLLTKGLKWWFSIIHPEDMEPMLRQIFKLCFLRPPAKRLNKPFSLEYRIKRPDGQWIWIHETKAIVSITTDGNNEFIIGILEDITAVKAEEEVMLKQLMKGNIGLNAMFKHGFPVIDPDLKKRADPFLAPNQYNIPEGMLKPTSRELDILELIGLGYSTKQIADKLSISINTVETHRRRLLEKLQVKNSMELIKQTRNALWLKAN
jgi:PAS domain S-box-containing protein